MTNYSLGTASSADQEVLQELIISLAYAQGVDTVKDALAAAPGVTREAVELLFRIPQAAALARLHPRPGAHAAVQATHRVNLIRRAAYYRAAAHRLTTATMLGPAQTERALVVERNYLKQHLAAVARREVVAAAVAATARQQAREAKRSGSTWNGLLGWYATIDELTSPECRRANRRNFDPRHVPAIGFPGAVHPSCRCVPGPPIPGAPRVERLRPERTTGQREAQPQRVTIGP